MLYGIGGGGGGEEEAEWSHSHTYWFVVFPRRYIISTIFHSSFLLQATQTHAATLGYLMPGGMGGGKGKGKGGAELGVGKGAVLEGKLAKEGA